MNSSQIDLPKDYHRLYQESLNKPDIREKFDELTEDYVNSVKDGRSANNSQEYEYYQDEQKRIYDHLVRLVG